MSQEGNEEISECFKESNRSETSRIVENRTEQTQKMSTDAWVQMLVEAIGWEMLDEMQPHEGDSDVVEHNDQSRGCGSPVVWYLPDLFHNI